MNTYENVYLKSTPRTPSSPLDFSKYASEKFQCVCTILCKRCTSRKKDYRATTWSHHQSAANPGIGICNIDSRRAPT